MIINASPLIIFSKVNRLDLLNKIFGNLVIAQAVYEEVVEKGVRISAPDALLVKAYIESGFIKIKKLDVEGQRKAVLLKKVYRQLDLGESETIALALQEKEKNLLIDERIAREIAKIHNLKPYGSLRVLLLAFKDKLITEDEVIYLLQEMTTAKFRLSAEVINQFWMLFNKLKNKK